MKDYDDDEENRFSAVIRQPEKQFFNMDRETLPSLGDDDSYKKFTSKRRNPFINTKKQQSNGKQEEIPAWNVPFNNNN